MATQTFTREQVTKNNNADSLHVIIDSKVYDLTDFADAHPGGVHVLLQVAGQDATSEFYSMHRHEILTKYAKMVIGTIQGETPQVIESMNGGGVIENFHRTYKFDAALGGSEEILGDLAVRQAFNFPNSML